MIYEPPIMSGIISPNPFNGCSNGKGWFEGCSSGGGGAEEPE